MKTFLCTTFVLLTLLFTDRAAAQSSAAYGSLSYPHSVMSAGMGGQGAAMKNTWDAMQYNPANLIYTDNLSASIFRNPWMISGLRLPLTSGTASLKLANGAAVGVEYTDWDFGSMVHSAETNPDGSELVHYYQRSVAGAFALPLGGEWALGAQVRYAWSPVGANDLSNDILFGAGASFTPAALSGRAAFGLSLMNFGAPLEITNEFYTQSYPMPAQINLAADYAVVRERLFNMSLALGFTKPVDFRDEDRPYAAQSSFKSLFTGWKNFPQDVTTHIGFGYVWKPLPLGKRISFLQEMYVGYYSVGPSSGYTSFYTHGVRAGIETHGVKATAGYAGLWHNNYIETYMPWRMPWETFQFTLSTDWGPAGVRENRTEVSDPLSRIILSGGYSYCTQVGRMAGEETYGGHRAYAQTSLWSAEADFYVNDYSAVIASLGYAHMTRKFDQDPTLHYFPTPWPRESGIETLALESGFRYHPAEKLHPFFIQASLGIMWLNPAVTFAEPRYSYTTFDNLSLGWTFPVSGTGMIVMPKAGFKTIFMQTDPRSSRLGGYSQFEFGVNIGYCV
jgi:hypothetical protein